MHSRFQTGRMILAVAVVLAASSLTAQTFTTVYNFTNGSNGGFPDGALAQGRDGAYYGVTYVGGGGTVFKISASGNYTLLHTLSSTDGFNCNGLVLGSDGNFYGTCFQGGNNANSTGTLFKVTPTGTLTVVHYFDGTFSGTTDGCYPLGLPVQASDGNFYGTARQCGANDGGLVYKLTPAGVFSVIHAFNGSTDGNQPEGALIQGSDGNLWGTTSQGGPTGSGLIFKMTLTGTETVIYNFNGCGAQGCNPAAALTQGNDGNYYGDTAGGGANSQGTVFKLSPAGVLTVLHSFNETVDNGAAPVEPLTIGTDGNFYGVATDCAGGGCSQASLFKITPAGVYTDIFNFPAPVGNNNSDPASPLFLSTSGTFYGTTYDGGSSSAGSFYSLAASQKAFITPQESNGRVGSKIGILGQGFSSSSVVKFNGVQATTVTLTGTTFLTATVPTGATDGVVTVTTGTTTLTSRNKFTVHNSWAAGAVMPTAREGMASGVIGGKLYVVSGATASAIVGNNEIYNPTTNTWTTGAAIPTPVFVPASAVVSNVLYVIGGIKDSSQTPLSIVQAYNPTTNTWSTKAPMPTATDSVNAVVLNNLIYVVGGYDGARSSLAQVYNPATDTWSTASNLLVPKSSSVLGVLGTTLVSSGGLENNGSPTGDTEGFSGSAWSALTADATPRNAACGAAISGQLYVTGGSTSNIAGSATATTESYNLTKNAWTSQLAAPLAVISASPAVVGGKLYCIGGTNNGSLFTGSVYNNVQIYQP